MFEMILVLSVLLLVRNITLSIQITILLVTYTILCTTVSAFKTLALQSRLKIPQTPPPSSQQEVIDRG